MHCFWAKSNTMAKKYLCILLATVMLCTLSGCSKMLGLAYFIALIEMGDDRAEKEDIFEFVIENEDALLKAIADGTVEDFENIDIIKNISVSENDGDIEFYCGGYGIGPSTSYVGFYYTPNEGMTSISPASLQPTPYGDGYEWREEDGDDRWYREHICGNFYYYEDSY